MAVELWKKAQTNLVEVQVQNKLAKEDYEKFAPEIDKMVAEHGKIKVLFRMDDFEGWEPSALWSDLKLDLKHFDDVEKIAFVGDEQWQRGMALFSKPFTTADVRYFQKGESEKAREWLVH